MAFQQRIPYMNTMHLIPTEDFELVKETYIDVIDHTPGIDRHARWVYGKHPDDELLRTYIENGEMYLFTDHEKVFGMVALVMHQDKAYETVPWEVIASNDQVATLRLLTICPEYRGQSLGNRLLDETIKIAAENGKKALRLDTLLSNTPAQHMYEKAGFSCRGTLHLFEESLGWTDFVFYEKVLESAN